MDTCSVANVGGRGIEGTSILNALGVAVVVADKTGSVVFLNDAAVQSYSGDRESLHGSKVASLLVGLEPHENVNKGLSQALSGSAYHDELTERGSLRQIGLSLTPMFEGDDGEVTGLVVISEQLTAVREAKAAAAASERRLRLAYDAAELGSWQWDVATGLVVWDERLEAIFGLPPGGYDGTFETWLAMIHPDEHAGVLAILDEAMAKKSSYNLNVRIVWPDGSDHWIESLGRVTTDEAGEPTGTIGCVWDTTDKREVERELAAAFDAQQRASTLAEEMSEEREGLMLRLSEIADHLQTSLAASPIPDVEGISIAVEYAPGGDELEHVGGDWYDAVRTPDGQLACVVGDVMGRGVRAATTMIRVRAGIRGLLTVDWSPEVVLSHADVVLDRDAPEQFVTAVVALVDPVRHKLTMCNAGHVPVVVSRPGGKTDVVGAGVGLPLGLPEGFDRDFLEWELEPGSTVVMVTDGVVEGRDYDIDEGIARMAAVATELAEAPVEEVARRVAALADRSLRDDVTVVVVRLD
jgi:PAS domain S-box-containing protein